MTETARILLTVAILSAVVLASFVWRLTRPDRTAPQRLVDQLYLSQWAALLLAATGAVSIGLAVSAPAASGATVEVLVGLATIGVSLIVLRREPREALVALGILFLLHAVFDGAHQPTLIVADFVPRWWTIGSAMYDVYIAALCLVAIRRFDDVI